MVRFAKAMDRIDADGTAMRRLAWVMASWGIVTSLFAEVVGFVPVADGCGWLSCEHLLNFTTIPEYQYIILD